MPLVGFDPAIPTSKRLQTYALDHVATSNYDLMNSDNTHKSPAF